MVSSRRWSAVLVPSPLDVWKYLRSAVEDGTIFQALAVTTKRLLVGYVIGVIAGIPLGLLTARFQAAHDTIGVLGLGLQTLPSVCWIPLALLWFGQTETAMIQAKSEAGLLADSIDAREEFLRGNGAVVTFAW